MPDRHVAGEYGGATGGERIHRAVDEAAVSSGSSVVTVGADGPDGGRWDLERAIELPSETTLFLDGAHLHLVDGANDNLVRNQNLEAGDEEVHIVGHGPARLDGNATNQDRDWDALWRSYGIHLFNVDSASIRGVTVGPTNCWAMTLEAVRDVRVSDVEFAQDGRTENQDGLHVLGPAERITVTGITGACGDDVIAVDTTESDPFGRGADGPIRAVTVTNVAVHNAHSTGLVRTIADRDAPLTDVYAGNLAMTGGTEIGDAVLKIGWAGWGVDQSPRPEDHCNITIENVFVETWDGPYCVVQAPVANLTLRGLRGHHTGPLFYTLENDVEGVVLDDCRTVLTGDPPDTLVNSFHADHIAGGEFRGQVLDRPPGLITLDADRCTDVAVTDCRFRTAVPDSTGTIGLRVYDGTTVDGLLVRDTVFDGFEDTLHVEDGATTRAITRRGVRHRPPEEG